MFVCAYVLMCVYVRMCICVKTGKIDKVMAVKRWKSCEMVQSCHMELVKYEKHDKVMAFSSYKNNLVKFVKTPPV